MALIYLQFKTTRRPGPAPKDSCSRQSILGKVQSNPVQLRVHVPYLAALGAISRC
jgi:hypothetical protein